jgi:transposase-like protein
VLGIYISEERNMLVAEKFIRSLVSKYGKHTVFTDGGTWHDEACNNWIKTLSTFFNREKSNGTS